MGYDILMTKKILLVEDDSLFRPVLKEKLETEGFNVSVAVDGAKAVAIVRENQFDLALIDMVLPKMNGIATAKQIKELNPDTEIIFLKNLEDNEHLAEALTMGLTDYIIKADWTINEIVGKVKAKLGLEQKK
ncbi:MAG: response regulator [Candidatus Parcubacteria bacterium]|nr:response regulator [Candidatus Parcubacteria bacterium]